MYKYMEPKRTEYKKSFVGSVSEEFFMAVNTLGIRHNKDNQIKLHYKRKNEVYDKLFRMALFVLQSSNVQEDRDGIKSLLNRGDS